MADLSEVTLINFLEKYSVIATDPHLTNLVKDTIYYKGILGLCITIGFCLTLLIAITWKIYSLKKNKKYVYNVDIDTTLVIIAALTVVFFLILAITIPDYGLVLIDKDLYITNKLLSMARKNICY